LKGNILLTDGTKVCPRLIGSAKLAAGAKDDEKGDENTSYNKNWNEGGNDLGSRHRLRRRANVTIIFLVLGIDQHNEMGHRIKSTYNHDESRFSSRRRTGDGKGKISQLSSEGRKKW
jgi:hypothetical protein